VEDANPEMMNLCVKRFVEKFVKNYVILIGYEKHKELMSSESEPTDMPEKPLPH